jgi:transposase
MKQKKSWVITDEFWEAAEPLIPRKERDPNKKYQRKSGGGRPPMEARKVLEAIFYVMRTGIQWNAIPKAFGSSSALHRSFQFWCEEGFFQALWASGLAAYDEAKGIEWTWLSADGCMTKAPLAQETVGKNPTDRGKKWQQAAFTRRRGRCTLGVRRNTGCNFDDSDVR